MAIKNTADYTSFASLDMRVGKITNVEDSATKKPTYRLTVDFGTEIGKKISCGAYRNYSKEELLGKQVVGVVNFVPKKMGPELSEVLILGVQNPKGETIYLKPQIDVDLGVEVF
ncbi:MAG: protein secretion chaperonin CsaA [Candidatus Paceibacterota bacterium]|jgi:tRNA-binding protein